MALRNTSGRGQHRLVLAVTGGDTHVDRERCSPCRPLIGLTLTVLAAALRCVDTTVSRRCIPPVGLGSDTAVYPGMCIFT